MFIASFIVTFILSRVFLVWVEYLELQLNILSWVWVSWVELKIMSWVKNPKLSWVLLSWVEYSWIKWRILESSWVFLRHIELRWGENVFLIISLNLYLWCRVPLTCLYIPCTDAIWSASFYDADTSIQGHQQALRWGYMIF